MANESEVWQQQWKHYRAPGNVMVSRRQRFIYTDDDRRSPILVEDVVLEEMPHRLELEERGVERVYGRR